MLRLGWSAPAAQLRTLAPALAAHVRWLAGEADQVISIDRSGLYRHDAHSHDASAQAHKEPETAMARHLKSLIKVGRKNPPNSAHAPCISPRRLSVHAQYRGGPITVAEYMSEVLTNPQAGYYTQRQVFGTAGDFITSPEISQMFGEMVGIWCVAMWERMGRPASLRLVELGPGRGTLMADLLRGTAPFGAFSAALSVDLVEVSPALQRKQWEALRCEGAWPEGTPPTEARSGLGGAQVRWHRSLEDVPGDAAAGPALYIAHEFLDALPVHQFQRTSRSWCERLVDVASADSPLHLRLVLSPGPTAASRTILPVRLEGLSLKERAALEAVEVCPQGMALAESLAQRVASHGGAALVVDYGQDAAYEGSLQAIHDHRYTSLLEQPGMADLSAWVDFAALRLAAERSGAAAECHGPIPQAHFLLGLGIQARLEQLLDTADEQQGAALVAGFERLLAGSKGSSRNGGSGSSASVDGSEPEGEVDGMGFSYKAFCIVPRGEAAPIAFEHAASPEPAV